MFKHLLTVVLMIATLSVSAQVKTVTGKVTDDSGTPIPGASVLVKGTSKGVATDFDGNYTLQANEGETIEFSSVGFQTESKKVVGGVSH